MFKAIIPAALAITLSACGSTTFVPTAVKLDKPKAPRECYYPDEAAKDLASLTVPAGDVTMLSLAASMAVTHRGNRREFRKMRQAFVICSQYVRRTGV